MYCVTCAPNISINNKKYYQKYPVCLIYLFLEHNIQFLLVTISKLYTLQADGNQLRRTHERTYIAPPSSRSPDGKLITFNSLNKLMFNCWEKRIRP